MISLPDMTSLSDLSAKAFGVLGDTRAEPDPISTLAAVAITQHKPLGTRLFFADHKVSIQDPAKYNFLINWLGTVRAIQGASREDLSLVPQSIEKVAYWYQPHKQDNEISIRINEFLVHVKEGMEKGLERSYALSGVTTSALKSWEELIENVRVREVHFEKKPDSEIDKKVRGLWIESEIALVNAYLRKMKQHKDPTMQSLEALLEQKSKELKELYV